MSVYYQNRQGGCYNFNVNEVLEVTGLFLAFGFLHSLCVRERVKIWAARLMGEMLTRGFYRFIYTLGSLLVTGITFYLIRRLPDQEIYQIRGFFRWLFHGVQLLGVIIGICTFRVIDFWRFVGLRQAVDFLHGREIGGDLEGLEEIGLVMNGAYGMVRHPLYLAGIMIFTFEPNITRNGIAVSILADLYFIYGAFSEERRLISRYGKEYEEYRMKVPMFLPLRNPFSRG